MKTHEELVEEVYNHPGFKNEFMSYARLKSTLETEWQSKPKAPAAPNPPGVRFISYYDIGAKTTVEPDSVLVSKCKRGICLLYSSLFRALSTSYNLDPEQTRRLIFTVADRHS